MGERFYLHGQLQFEAAADALAKWTPGKHDTVQRLEDLSEMSDAASLQAEGVVGQSRDIAYEMTMSDQLSLIEGLGARLADPSLPKATRLAANALLDTMLGINAASKIIE